MNCMALRVYLSESEPGQSDSQIDQAADKQNKS